MTGKKDCNPANSPIVFQKIIRICARVITFDRDLLLNGMDTLEFIIKRYDIKLTDDTFLVQIPYGRWNEMGALFRDLGFRKGAEIGVHTGRFSKALCVKNPKLELTGVDSWSVYKDYGDYGTNSTADEAFAEAVARNAKFKIRFIKAFSMDAVKEFADESLDFVYIDANHNYEYVVADIAAWSKKVRKGGIVCGHDYSDKFNFRVIGAVNGWCRSYNIKPLFLWQDDRSPSWMY